MPGRFIFLMCCMLLSYSLTAKTPLVKEQVQLPACLANNIKFAHKILAENAQYKIIELNLHDLDTLSQLAEQIHCGHFVNVSHLISSESLTKRQETAAALLDKPAHARTFAGDNRLRHQKLVRKALQQIDLQAMWQTITHLSAFVNRSAFNENGVKTAEWIKEQVDRLILEHGNKDAETFYVQTRAPYVQPSVVTVIGKSKKAPAIVIGAHMDTLGRDGMDRMPGADDDATGSATAMEIARILLAADIQFKRPIYIIWYAAEERGLVGSQQVVQDFMQKSIPVHAVLQLDMTGYRHHAKDNTMWIFTDYTNQKLNRFLAQLIKAYIKVPVAYSQCGYGCSDHASWTQEGIPASFPCETSFEDHNPFIHTAADGMNLLNQQHMRNYTKLGLAFAIELAAK
ncbi:aminopeptidase LapA [Legionella septentrionalis]|uniref:M20/M25/M40 family metallo-hydrolase n=1 Tax=Legionella septentrionalis TaxID=2498109 RepID=A0A3S0XTI0_9GAMM|nr:M20/M25/M40 family metallo-hydrolase [Legionella septentrionalis]RUQ88685.1 M20/M25/M40 family metallo-hydrolase [Legionella septentrionalis]